MSCPKITGISGVVGFRTLVKALRAGYRVRGTVRREGWIDQIKKAASIQPYLDNLEIIIVSDITKDGAFDKALNGVDYVLHIASPLPTSTNDYERDIIKPAIGGTMSILKSANKVSTVKRVVVTSSSVVIFPPKIDPNRVYSESNINPPPQGPYAHPFQAYTASKILAHHATDAWYADASPSFSLVRILPTFVVGKHELATSKSAFLTGSNAIVFSPLVGEKTNDAVPGATVHLDDVANAHVQSLGLHIDGNQNFLLSSDTPAGIVFNDAIEIAKKNFPEAVKSGVLPLGGNRPTERINLDVSKAEKAFGWQHKPFEEQVKSIVGQWIELSTAA
ncbi:MAG: hypothetical protein M1840_009048 [Geoglossum simile]|nr:MAG: hypothetical protein M1840_009048 [Geoglossum simile]